MTSPVIIFDHINKVTAITGIDPRAEQQLTQAIGRQTVATASGGQPSGQ